MFKFAVVLLLFSLGGAACMTSRAVAPPSESPVSPTAPAVTAMIAPASETPSLPAPPELQQDTPAATDPPQPTATLISEVLPVERPPESIPQPTAVRGGTTLPVPKDTTVVWGGCASDGECHWFNFYWAPTREVVMQDGEPERKVQHELCHAHQHWSINGGAPLDPSDYDLESWYATAEGRSFMAAVAGLAWPWTHSAVNGLEDFAWTCTYWYLDPAYLLSTSAERYAWALENLP